MNNTWNNLDRIEAYKKNELDSEARKNFETDLMHNSELSKEVEVYDRLLEHIEVYGNTRVKNTLNKVVANLEKENFFKVADSGIRQMNSIKSRNSFPLLAIAASVVVLIAASYFIFLPKSHPLPDMAEMRFEKVELEITIDKLGAAAFANSEKGKNDTLAAALRLYKDFEYTKSRMALLQYLNNYPNDQIATLYLGLSYLQNAEYGKAAKYLTPLTRMEDFEFKNMAKWYSSMCYTQFGGEANFKTAKVLLKELADDHTSDYADYAKAYLDLLNN
ncbi:MAG: hypothetical protein ABIO44_11675 [Saprospiraceae bacterium]